MRQDSKAVVSTHIIIRLTWHRGKLIKAPQSVREVQRGRPTLLLLVSHLSQMRRQRRVLRQPLVPSHRVWPPVSPTSINRAGRIGSHAQLLGMVAYVMVRAAQLPGRAGDLLARAAEIGKPVVGGAAVDAKTAGYWGSQLSSRGYSEV